MPYSQNMRTIAACTLALQLVGPPGKGCPHSPCGELTRATRMLAVSALLLIHSSTEGRRPQNRPSPTKCQGAGGTSADCGPGNDLCHSPGYGHNAPQYHVRDQSCAMNDPAAVIYDPVHAIYHDHWEDHLAMPGGQYVRGHAISRDLIHWAHLPVSLWNDRPYDQYAIFTGSATLVEGKVVQIYPGLCNGKSPGCPGGTNLAIAVPEDPSDPFQTNWLVTLRSPSSYRTC